jgi:hypothetical protein
MRNDTAWEMTGIEVRRQYSVTDAPDLQDTTARMRRVIRPRRVRLNQVFGTNAVRHATIEGRQVRRDGGLGESRTILAGPGQHDAAPPAWLNEILDGEGLEWSGHA